MQNKGQALAVYCNVFRHELLDQVKMEQKTIWFLKMSCHKRIENMTKITACLSNLSVMSRGFCRLGLCIKNTDW